MESNALQKLIDRARGDPQFLHALVFDTESVLKEIDYLDRGTKASLVAISPEEAIARIVGARSAVGTTQGYAP